MAERAHPDDPAFQDHWRLRRRFRGLIPWPTLERSPYRRGLLERYRFCQRYVRDRRVLDVPCGVGWGTSLLRGTRRLVGVDLDPEAIAFARSRYGGNAEFVVGGMEALGFPAGAFDVVLCLEGIEHVPEEVAARFIAEAARVLVPGGTLVLTSPLPDPARPPNPYHLREYHQDELLERLAPCFDARLCEVRDVGGIRIVYYVGTSRTAQAAKA